MGFCHDICVVELDEFDMLHYI